MSHQIIPDYNSHQGRPRKFKNSNHINKPHHDQHKGNQPNKM